MRIKVIIIERIRKKIILFKNVFIFTFAILGFSNILLFLATKFQWTNESGIIDKNDRLFQEIVETKKITVTENDSLISHYQYNLLEGKIFQKLLKLNNSYPQNAHLIYAVYRKTKDIELANAMLMAGSISLPKINDSLTSFSIDTIKNNSKYIQNWMNSKKWEVLKEILIMEKTSIDSAALITGVDSRIILCCLIGEQMRIFNQNRERVKNFLGPFRKLAFMTNLSYGVTGIKEGTAILVENYLKDSSSVYYLGKEYEHLLDYKKTDNIKEERLNRLKNYNNHFYSYLYTALILKQTKVRWEKEGYDISNRPEILATLYNIGFWKSKPKKNPRAGGALFIVNNDSCTFGGVAFDFYYSGQLYNEFPYSKDKWMLPTQEFKQNDITKKINNFDQNINNPLAINLRQNKSSKKLNFDNTKEKIKEQKLLEEILKPTSDSISITIKLKLIDQYFD